MPTVFRHLLGAVVGPAVLLVFGFYLGWSERAEVAETEASRRPCLSTPPDHLLVQEVMEGKPGTDQIRCLTCDERLGVDPADPRRVVKPCRLVRETHPFGLPGDLGEASR